MIEIGKKAPAFHIADGEGEKHRLSSYTEHYVVLYFYPKDDTSGCTKEAVHFAICIQIFELGCVVFWGESRPCASHAKFAAKYELNFPCWPTRKTTKAPPCARNMAFGKRRACTARSGMGVVRTTYLIARGKVLQRWDKVVPGHAGSCLGGEIKKTKVNG